jgi:D-glycero-alpha-D-manno-heptose-7-phosphate kinase
VLDAGGWTDTWFAHGGVVCHLAVDDGVEVSARRCSLSATDNAPTAELHVPDLGDDYRYPLDQPPGRHPLLEGAFRRWVPPDCSVEVTVTSSVPPGSGLGTSAAVLVALIAAFRALAGESFDPQTLARAAHRIETVDLGLQSGVQDQIAAAYGGSNLLTIDSYPDADVRPLDLATTTWDALTRRIVTVYLGRPHHSSTTHQAVIAHLASTDADRYLAPLRDAARDAAAALEAGNLDGYGQALIANTQAQAGLHPALVDPIAREVIGLSARHGAVGWKVNGAGGEGGTVSIVAPEPTAHLLTAVRSITGVAVLPLRPARRGVRIVDQA